MRSLRARIALVYIALIVAAMAALGLTLLRTEERRFRRSLDERMLAEARLVAEAVTPALRAPTGDGGIDALTKRLGAEGGLRVTVIAPDGVVLGDSENDPRALDNHGGRPEVMMARSSGVGRATRRSDTERRDFSYLA